MQEPKKFSRFFRRFQQRLDSFAIADFEKAAPEQAGQKKVQRLVRGTRRFVYAKGSARGPQVLFSDVRQAVPGESAMIEIQVDRLRLAARRAKPDGENIITLVNVQHFTTGFAKACIDRKSTRLNSSH